MAYHSNIFFDPFGFVALVNERRSLFYMLLLASGRRSICIPRHGEISCLWS